MIKGDNGVTEMTANSGMVYGRLLLLGGERATDIRYVCLWQNYPVQFHVNLSVPTHITTPLRANQKYVYRKIKLHVHKIRSYAKHSDL